MTGKNDADVHFVGQSVVFPCPECGERLWVFLPADGGVEVVRQRDIPSDEDDEEADEDDEEADAES